MGLVGTLGAVDSLTIGGYTQFVDIRNSGLILLAGATSNGGNQRATMRKPSGTAGYQVTVGKTLRIFQIELLSRSTNQVSPIFAQTDNDVGWVSATAFTNPVYMYGNSSSGQPPFATSTTAGNRTYTATLFDVAATKYFSTDSGSGTDGCSMQAFGYEI